MPTILQVSSNPADTLANFKFMSGKRASREQLAEVAVVLSKHHVAFAEDSNAYVKFADNCQCQHTNVADSAKPVHFRPFLAQQG